MARRNPCTTRPGRCRTSKWSQGNEPGARQPWERPSQFDKRRNATMKGYVRRRRLLRGTLLAASSPGHAQSGSDAERNGWLNNEKLSTPYGEFEFRNGYPVGDSGARLLEQLKLNRAVDVYLTQ